MSAILSSGSSVLNSKSPSPIASALSISDGDRVRSRITTWQTVRSCSFVSPVHWPKSMSPGLQASPRSMMLPGCGSLWKNRSRNIVMPMPMAMSTTAWTALALTAGSSRSTELNVFPGRKVCVSTDDDDSSSTTTGIAILEAMPWRWKKRRLFRRWRASMRRSSSRGKESTCSSMMESIVPLTGMSINFVICCAARRAFARSATK
mmetsp:Transcript_28570/g.92405  ORF Transcript_28570/g.92405 Transcript_28570/m.92405 type:complete len:205 (-) Transcript_28570:217-831(-)